jgi:ribosomal protein S18 acetylase RimI-like enzyme
VIEIRPARTGDIARLERHLRRRRGHPGVALCVDVENGPARRLYENEGYLPAPRATILDPYEEIDADGVLRRWTAVEMVMVKRFGAVEHPRPQRSP